VRPARKQCSREVARHDTRPDRGIFMGAQIEAMLVSEAKDQSAAPPRPAGPSDFSVHMDAVRGAMALIVFYQHITLLFFADYRAQTNPGIFERIGFFMAGLGHLAVMVFFVLSGFFIGSSVLKAVRSGAWSFRWYAIQRLTRLMVVLAPALCLGACLDKAGLALFGGAGAYAAGQQYYYIVREPVASHLSALIGLENLCFLQWIKAPCLGSNGPLWSLSYEFWYYAMFPLFLLAAIGRFRLATRVLLAALGVCIAIFVNVSVAIYFSVWLLGALLAALPVRRWPALANNAGLMSCLVLLIGTTVAWRLKHYGFWGDLSVGASFAGFMYFLRALTADRYGCRALYKRVATFLSGISYSLYLLHVPGLFFLNALFIGQGLRWQVDAHHLMLAFLAAAITFTYVLAVWSLTEARTKQVRDAVKRVAMRAAA
jgi:peptidoglycan/LPS O-acetylase OafA/YrhL